MSADIYKAIGEEDLVAVTECLNTDQDFERDGGWLPLHAASKCGNLEIVKAILAYMNASAYESSINSRFEVGDDCEYQGTALTEALLNDHKEVVIFLVEHGADVNATYYSESRNSPEWFFGEFDLATDGGVAWWLADMEFRELCLQRNLDIDATDDHGKSLLAYAVDKSGAELVRWLLEHGANAAAHYAFGDNGEEYPLLTWAAIQHEEESEESLAVVKLLLEYGAPVGAVSYGESVIDTVLDQGNAKLIKLFGLSQVAQMICEQDDTLQEQDLFADS